MLSHTTKIAVYLVAMAAAEYPEEGECVFPVSEQQWEDMLDRLLSKLPELKQIYFNSTEFEETVDYFLFLRPGNITLLGFKNLNRDGTIRSYCAYGNPFIEVGIRSKSSVGWHIPFEYCGTKFGAVAVNTPMIKFLCTFQLEEYGSGSILRLVEVVRLWSLPTRVNLLGFGGEMQFIASMIGKVLAPFYNEYFLSTVTEQLWEMIEDVESD